MDLPAPTSRARRGRWLGGVCAGLAKRWDIAPGRVRLVFAAAAPVLGLGVLVYLACWLILPAESEDGVTAGQRGIVLLAQASGALLGLATLACAGAVATVFGFGWVVVALAAAVLVGGLAGWVRVGPAWALLPIVALVLPSVAMAVGGLRIEPSTTSFAVAPRALSDVPLEGYKSGLGLLTIDLRRTALPADGRIELPIQAGVRRTLVALPHDRCVHVSVTQRDKPVALRIGTALLGDPTGNEARVVLFGHYYAERHVTSSVPTRRRPGPTLHIDFSSAGGQLVVRDYPADFEPSYQPDWPGYPVFVEGQPDTAGLSRKEAAGLVREWRERRRGQERSKRLIDRLLPGPCATERKR